MLALVVISGVFAGACGTARTQVQPSAAVRQSPERLAVVVTGNGLFRVVAERDERTGSPAAKGATLGGLGGALWPGWDTALGLGRCDVASSRTDGERLRGERRAVAADAARRMTVR
jgi:hypothetical protein